MPQATLLIVTPKQITSSYSLCMQFFVSVEHPKHYGTDVSIPTTPEVSETNSKTITQLTGSDVYTLTTSQ